MALAFCILCTTSCMICFSAIAMALYPHMDSRGAWASLLVILCLSVLAIVGGVGIENKIVLYVGAVVTAIDVLIILITSIMFLVYIVEENRKSLETFTYCEGNVENFYGDLCDYMFENKTNQFAEHISGMILMICYCCPLVFGTVQYARQLK